MTKQQATREASEELGTPSLATKFNQRTGRPVRTTAGRRSLDPGYMDTTEVIEDEDIDDSDDFLDDDEDLSNKKRKKLQGGSRKRKRMLSPPPPSLSDVESDAFLSRESSPAFSVGTPAETLSIVAEAMMEPINLTFNVPLGFHGPLRVQIDQSLLQQLGRRTKLGQSPTPQAITGPAQSNSVWTHKTGFLDLAAGTYFSHNVTHSENLADISTELRNQVYRLIFVKDPPIEISRPMGLARCAALLRTCRQIYDEGCSILYGENVFHFDRDRNNRRKRWDSTSKEVGYKDFRRFLGMIGPHNVSKMRDVAIRFEDCHPRDMPCGSVEERRYVHDGNLIECLKMLGRDAEVRKLYLGFHGRRSLACTDLRFLEHLCVIKADKVLIKSHPKLPHNWYYTIDRINADVRVEIVKKIKRKTKLYPDAIESMDTESED